jgi:hypothetical protein
MRKDPNLVGSVEAAKRLGLAESRVRALAQQGRLPAQRVAGRWLLDANLLIDFGRAERKRGRPYDASRALGLLFLLSGEDAPWLSSYDAWRLRHRARRADIRKLLPRLAKRAAVRHFQAPNAVLEKVASDPAFIRSGVSAASDYDADISAPHVVEGYYPKLRADQLAYRYALEAVPEARANLIIHGLDQPVAVKRDVMPLAVVAADLIESRDSRTRRAGEKLLLRLPPQ